MLDVLDVGGGHEPLARGLTMYDGARRASAAASSAAPAPWAQVKRAPLTAARTPSAPKTPPPSAATMSRADARPTPLDVDLVRS